MSEARSYQIQAMEEIRNEFRRGHKKVLLWLATGAGKTFVFCRMVKDAVSKGRRCIIVVRGRKLVDQASQRLTREGVDHGVLMAAHWNYRPNASVQVCSIDTLIVRNLKPHADLIIIDEAHLAVSKGYSDFLKQYDTFIVAVTATPWVHKGLRHIADTFIHPITMDGLIEANYLVPFRYFAPSEPDLKDVQVSSSTKDYITDQLEGAMVAGQLTGKIIEHWIKIADNKPTICFAVSVHHSNILVERFIAAGVKAEHCDANTPDGERNEIIKRLESGETKVVCNVGIFCTGVDIPGLGAIIMARPTKSRNLYIQQAGRGTRTASGKNNCILLDHAGNIGRFGFPTEEPELDLDGVPEREKHDKESKTCKNCFAVYRGPRCPECGVEAPPAPAIDIAESDDELKEITAIDPVLQSLKEFSREAKKLKRKPASAYYKLINRFGFEACKKYLPVYFVTQYMYNQSNAFRGSPYRGVKAEG